VEDALAEVLHEVLWSIEQIAQKLSICFYFGRVVSVNRGRLQVCIECFVPGPPFSTIRKESEYPASRIKPVYIVSESAWRLRFPVSSHNLVRACN
jgi:hypothetical protein